MKPDKFRDAWIIYLLSTKLAFSPNMKVLHYYIGNFIRVHYGMKYGISSEQFGNLITKFSLLAKSYHEDKNLLLENMIEEVKMESIKDDIHLDFFDALFQFSTPASFSKNLRISYSKNLEKVAKLTNLTETNPIRSYGSAFSKTKKNQIDWRIPFPKPDFKQYKFGDAMVINGLGFWLPKISYDRLEDVALVFLSV